MKALDRKLLRELRQHWSQVLSIAAVVGCGVMAALAMRSTLASVQWARDDYYDRHRFAHVFAHVQRAPEALAGRLAAIPGVAAVQTRVTMAVRLDVPGLDEPALGQVVSIPAAHVPMPNDLHIRRGRWVAGGRPDEVLVSDRFAGENHLQPGDTLGAVLEGRWQRLRIVGIASSPEFVYEIGASGFMVDNRRFGILWMERDAVAAAAGTRQAFNDVTLRLAPGASEPAVLDAVDAVLRPWGGTGAHGRATQPSHQVLEDEFGQLRTMAKIFPLFFLATSAFLLNVVLSRIVATQREELAALKAFGYSNVRIAIHFLGFAIAAVVAGSVLGVAGGVWLGSEYTAIYDEFFKFPVLRHQVSWTTAGVSIGISAAAAMLGAAHAVWQAARLPPAEALRPPMPARFRPLLAERLGLAGLLSPAARMIMRNLERRPLRTLTSVLGVGLAGALLVAGRYPFDGVHKLMDVQMRLAQREDYTVGFTRAHNGRAARELRALPGVLLVEPFRAVPVRLYAGHHVRTVPIMGIEGAGVLRRLYDADGHEHPLPPGGAVLTSGLARAMGIRAGDTVQAEVFELGGVTRPVVVTALIDESMGAQLYMERRALNAWMREGDVVSGALLRVTPGSWPRARDRLRRMPAVVGATSRQAMIDYIDRTMARNIAITTTVIVVAAAAIALATVYNGARVALSERGRELASLRVLGFTRREVSGLLLGEQAAITVAGTGIGFGIGYAFAAMLSTAFAGERHHFPLVIRPGTYAFSTIVVAVTAVVAALIVRRRVDHLDLVAVLKTRE